MRIFHLTILPSLFLAACGSARDAAYDPAIEARFREQNQRAQEARDRLTAIDRVMLDLDRNLNEYFSAMLNSGFARADSLALGLENFIRQRVAENFDQLVAFADGAGNDQIDAVAAGVSRELASKMNAATLDLVRNQQIAMAALGFSNRQAALDPMLNGAASKDPKIAGNAVLGLAILGDSRTPPEVIARVMENKRFSEIVRTSAAWSLYRLQSKLVSTSAIIETWRQNLVGPIDEGKIDGVLTSALRGVGLSRDRSLSKEVMRYASHPTPIVRMGAAIALGRLQDPSAVDVLLTLIEPAEQNPNVRLAARKSLQALAGGNDRGYDIKAWRELFQRGL